MSVTYLIVMTTVVSFFVKNVFVIRATTGFFNVQIVNNSVNNKSSARFFIIS